MALRLLEFLFEKCKKKRFDIIDSASDAVMS